MSRAVDSVKSQTARGWWVATWGWRRWLGLGVCAVAVTVMIYGDEELRQWYRALVPNSAELTALANALTKTLHPGLVVLMIVGACVAMWERWGEMAKAMFAGIAVQTVSIAVLKDLIGRGRPVHTGGVSIFSGPQFGSHSMPSGHASVAFVLAATLSGFFPRGRWLFYPLAAAIALARVHVDRHFFSDVVVGAILGMLIGQWVVWRFRRAPEPAAEADEAAMASAEAQVEPVHRPL